MLIKNNTAITINCEYGFFELKSNNKKYASKNNIIFCNRHAFSDVSIIDLFLKHHTCTTDFFLIGLEY